MNKHLYPKDKVVHGQPKELSIGDRLHRAVLIIEKSREDSARAFYNAGLALKEVRDDELWRESYESFVDFYAQMGFEKTRVSRAIKTVESFKLKEILDIELGKLYAILPIANSSNKTELVKMAQSLSRSDLYHQLKVKRVAEVAPKIPEMPKTYPCTECGRTKGIRFIDLCYCRMNEKQAKYIQRIIDKVEQGDYEV